MENLILFCGNNAQGDERIMNILEIVVLMLREQVCEIMFGFFFDLEMILLDIVSRRIGLYR
jgi:hypothetical protein